MVGKTECDGQQQRHTGVAKRPLGLPWLVDCLITIQTVSAAYYYFSSTSAQKNGETEQCHGELLRVLVAEQEEL